MLKNFVVLLCIASKILLFASAGKANRTVTATKTPGRGGNGAEVEVNLNEANLNEAKIIEYAETNYTTNSMALIRKGTKSKMGYFPSQVDVKDALTSKHRCSGTLIEDKHVVTAARCVTKSTAKDLAVMAGDVNLLPGQIETRESRRVQLIATHPDYTENEDEKMEYNIAILRLDMPFSRSNFLHPAVISTTKIKNNTLCFMVGWGSGDTIDSGGTSSNDLYFTDVYTKEMEQCYKCVSNAICAGTSETKACIGDIGGSLMCNGFLYGIYIGSVNNCQSLTGIYTDVVFYKHWIDRIINWIGEGPTPLPLPYARKRKYLMKISNLKNASNKIGNVYNIYLILTLALSIANLPPPPQWHGFHGIYFKIEDFLNSVLRNK